MAADRSRLRPAVLFLAGALLFACGYISLNLPQTVVSLLSYWPRSGLVGFYADVQNAMALRLLAGVPFLVPGGLMMALALAAKATPVSPGLPVARAYTAVASTWGLRACVAVALIMGGATAWLMRDPPQPAASYTWVASLMACLVAAAASDRAAGAVLPAPLLTRSDRLIAAGLFLATVLLVGHDLGHWRWSGIPDEFSFYAGAKGFYDGIIPTHPLSEQGVFGYHPVLSSYYQVVFMWLGGPNVIAWRLSSVVSLAIAVVCTFQLTAQLRNRRAALWAAVLLATAQIAMSYSHLGYNNAQVYAAVLLPLGLAAWASRGRCALLFALAGLCCGLAFYTYFTARLAPLLVVLLWWERGTLPVLRRQRRLAVAFAGTLALAVIPTAAQLPRTLAQMIRLTGATANQALPFGAALSALASSLSFASLRHIGGQWLMSIFYPMTSESGHFMVEPVADVGTSFLWLIGLCGGIVLLVRQRRDFLSIAYVGSAFAVGAISPYPYPALTRLMFLAPFTAILAALGTDTLFSVVQVTTRRGHLARNALTTLLIGAIAAVNVYTLHANVYDKYYGYGDGTTSELVRLALDLPAATHLVYVQRDDTYMAGTVPDVLTAYGVGVHLNYIRPPFSPAVLEPLETIEPPLLVACDLPKPEQLQTIDELLRRRFPEAVWTESAPGHPWNLHCFYVPPTLDRSGTAPIHKPILATSTPENSAHAGEEG